jgi:hypothetical protein
MKTAIKFEFEVNTTEELKLILQSTQVDVPASLKLRHKSYGECYSMHRILSYLVEKGVISGPTKLTHDDRPEFCLSHKEYQIGYEVTEAIPQRLRYAQSKIQEIEGFHQLPISLFDDDNEISKKQLANLLQSDFNQAPGYQGYEAEIKWSDLMLKRTSDKIFKLNENGFRIYDEANLVIYDNFIPVASADAMRYFLPRLFDLYNEWILDRMKVFHKIFIIRPILPIDANFGFEPIIEIATSDIFNAKNINQKIRLPSSVGSILLE